MKSTKIKYLITLPVVLSFIIPGLGQLYKGHWWRAAAMLLSLVLYIWLDYSGLFVKYDLFLSFLHFGLMAWSVYDASQAVNDWQ